MYDRPQNKLELNGSGLIKSQKMAEPTMPTEMTNKRFEQIIKDINIIQLDFQTPGIRPTMEKKLQSYNKINKLVDEASQLLNRLETDVLKMETKVTNALQFGKINHWLEMLSNNKSPKVGEIIYIVEQFKAMQQEISSAPEIVDNVEQDQEIIYEEENAF